MELKIAHHNIRSLNNKIHELKLFIQTNNPDIITLNETLKINNKSKIYGYNISQPTNNTGKGVAILYKYNIDITELPPITTTDNTNNLQHSILITTPTKQIQITTIYCPSKKPSTELLNGIMT